MECTRVQGNAKGSSVLEFHTAAAPGALRRQHRRGLDPLRGLHAGHATLPSSSGLLLLLDKNLPSLRGTVKIILWKPAHYLILSLDFLLTEKVYGFTLYFGPVSPPKCHMDVI